MTNITLHPRKACTQCKMHVSYLSQVFLHFSFRILHFFQTFLEADIDCVTLLPHVPGGVGQDVVN